MEAVNLQKAAAQASAVMSVVWGESGSDVQVGSSAGVEDGVDCGGLAVPSILDGRSESGCVRFWAKEHIDTSSTDLAGGEVGVAQKLCRHCQDLVWLQN
mmetsp:Transcript_37807/g.79195  ORF Transcript_37807/g.79195 Transcript_37807/m.79195 type:complete len:99 (+) Transcript_37807:273-569(+)